MAAVEAIFGLSGEAFTRSKTAPTGTIWKGTRPAAHLWGALARLDGFGKPDYF